MEREAVDLLATLLLDAARRRAEFARPLNDVEQREL
jgi:hypothetical protein